MPTLTNLTFPIPNISNGTENLLSYGNAVTNDLFGVTILGMIFAVMFISLLTNRNKMAESLSASLFTTTTVAWIMVLIPGFVSAEIASSLALLTAVSVFFMYKNQ